MTTEHHETAASSGHTLAHVTGTLAIAGLAAALLATAISTQTYLSMPGHGHNATGIFLWQLACWGMWALASPLVLDLGARLAATHTRRRATIATIVAMGIVGTFAHLAVCAALAVRLNPYQPEIVTSFSEAFDTQLESLLPLDILTFVLLVYMGWGMAVSRRARQLEAREALLEAELTRAKLETLRLEIQPHFLFNTLNAISALIRTNANDRALSMLFKLGDLMRQTLDRHQEPMVTLDAEMAFTAQYLDLQMLRFGDRLQVRVHTSPDCGDCLVPTLVLQPLVENALRHGFAKVHRPGTLEIGASQQRDTLVVSVSDNGAGLPPGFSLERHAGTGLGNTLTRLKRLFGTAGSLNLTDRPGGGTIATIVLPITRRSAQADVA